MIGRTKIIKTGSGTLRQKMTLHTPAQGWNPEKYFPLVWSIARKYSRENNAEDSDAFGEGLLCLIKAVRTYDSDQGTKLETWIHEVVKTGLNMWKRSENQKKRQICTDYSDELETALERDQEGYPMADAELLRDTIDGIGDDQQRTIALLRLDGQVWNQIGQTIGCNYRTAQKSFDRDVMPLIQARLAINA